MTKTCAIIGCSPMCFPWGFDEEDEGCAALKLLLLNQITRYRSEGCTREAAAAAVAEMLNKQVLTLDPRAVRLQ